MFWGICDEGPNKTKVFENTPQNKLGFPLEIFSVNMTKSSVSCGYGHIYQKCLMENFIFCGAI